MGNSVMSAHCRFLLENAQHAVGGNTGDMLPIIYSPITKYLASWGGVESGPCGDFYLDFMRCASRVGSQRALAHDCVKELADFHECAFELKQIERVKLMYRERQRQNRAYVEPLAEDILRKGAC